MSGSVDGLVSGLSTSSLISQLMQVEAIPKQRLQVQVNKQASDIKAYQSLATALKKLDDAAVAIGKPAALAAFTATTSGTSVSATARAGAPVGTTDIEVLQLATAARWTTGTALGLDEAGHFTTDPIEVTKADGTTSSVTPKAGTMREVMAAINGDPSLGLTAVAVRVTADTYRLQVVANGTGTEAAPTSVTGLGTDVTQTAATDAVWRIGGAGGIEGRSGSNSVTDLVSGVDVTLTQVGTTSVTVAKDTEATAKAVEALVAAVNEALAEVKKQTLTLPGATTRGPLASDSMVRGLTAGIMRAVTDTVGSAAAAGFGIQSTREGTITLDKTKLTAALATDPATVTAVLAPPPLTSTDAAGKTVTTPAGGIADRLRAVVDRATDAGDGFITSAVQGRETTKRDLETQILSWDRRLELRKSTLQKQFTGLEVALGKIQSQGSWLSAQLAGLQSSSAANR